MNTGYPHSSHCCSPSNCQGHNLLAICASVLVHIYSDFPNQIPLNSKYLMPTLKAGEILLLLILIPCINNHKIHIADRAYAFSITKTNKLTELDKKHLAEPEHKWIPYHSL